MNTKNKFLAFADLHAHKWNDFGYIDPVTNTHTRVLDAINVLNQMKLYAEEHNIKLFLFGGDLFELQSSVPFSVSNPVFLKIREILDSGIKMVMVTGNHDLATANGDVHALANLRHSNCFIFNKPGSIKIDNVRILCLPYQRDSSIFNTELIKGEYDVCLTHLDVFGAQLDNTEATSMSSIKLSDLSKVACDIFLSGHIHKHQKLGSRFYYIGSTAARHRSDANTKFGFLDVEKIGSKYDIQQIETVAPRIIRLRFTITKTGLLKYNENMLLSNKYVYAEIYHIGNITQELRDEIGDILDRALAYQITNTYEAVVNPKRIAGCDVSNTIPNNVKAYVEAANPEDLDIDRLVELGCAYAKRGSA